MFARTGHMDQARREPSHQAGVTLVELMISVLLAAILSAGLLYMMSGQSRAYRTQITHLTTQENLWGAMEFLQRNVRMAGFGLGRCPAGRVMHWDGAGGTKQAYWLVPIRVYNGCNLLTDSHDPPCPAGVADAPDSFSVSYFVVPPSIPPGYPPPWAVRLIRPMETSDAPMIVDSPGLFVQDTHVSLWQPGTANPCTLLRLTAPPQTTPAGFQLAHDPSGAYNPPLAVNPPNGTDLFQSFGGYATGTLVLNVSTAGPRHFAIDYDPNNPQKVPRLVTWTSGPAPVPSMVTNDLEVVADGIEDMQVSYACDDGTPPDGLFAEGTDAASQVTDEWAHNIAGETDTDGNGLPDPMTCNNGIGVVRITLIARSPSPEDVKELVRRPGAEDRPAGALDAYPRRKLTVTVSPRNLRSEP